MASRKEKQLATPSVKGQASSSEDKSSMWSLGSSHSLSTMSRSDNSSPGRGNVGDSLSPYIFGLDDKGFRDMEIMIRGEMHHLAFTVHSTIKENKWDHLRSVRLLMLWLIALWRITRGSMGVCSWGWRGWFRARRRSYCFWWSTQSESQYYRLIVFWCQYENY